MLALAGFNQRVVAFAATDQAADEFIGDRLQDQTVIFTIDAEARSFLYPEFLSEIVGNHDGPRGTNESRPRLHLTQVQ